MNPPTSTDDLVTFRDVGVDHISEIVLLAQRIWWACYPGILSDAQIRHMLAASYDPERILAEIQGQVRWVQVEVCGRPEGFLSWELHAGVVHLHKLYLSPEFHGRGIGQQMLDHVRNRARLQGANRIELRVNRANFLALRAYRRAGFTALRDDCHPIGNGFVMDDHILTLEIQ